MRTKKVAAAILCVAAMGCEPSENTQTPSAGGQVGDASGGAKMDTTAESNGGSSNGGTRSNGGTPHAGGNGTGGWAATVGIVVTGGTGNAGMAGNAGARNIGGNAGTTGAATGGRPNCDALVTDLTCTKDSDCCLVYNGCYSGLWLVKDTQKAAVSACLWAPYIMGCPACWPPEVQVSCRVGFCYAEEITLPTSYDLTHAREPHCGLLPLVGAAGAESQYKAAFSATAATAGAAGAAATGPTSQTAFGCSYY